MSSPEIGTLRWIRESDGRLTASQAMRYAAALAAGQVRILGDSRRARPAVTGLLELVATPPSAIAAEVEHLAREQLPPPILNHSLRVRAWMHILLDAADQHVDPDLVHAAALFHDAGLVHPGNRRRCFTARSVDIAAQILEKSGFDETAVNVVAEAIVGHLNARPPTESGPLTSALHAATHLDVSGAGRHRLPTAAITSVNAHYPRVGFTGCFSGSFRREFLRAPLTRAGVSWAVGLPLAIRLNPIESV